MSGRPLTVGPLAHRPSQAWPSPSLPSVPPLPRSLCFHLGRWLVLTTWRWEGSCLPQAPSLHPPAGNHSSGDPVISQRAQRAYAGLRPRHTAPSSSSQQGPVLDQTRATRDPGWGM